VCELIMLPEQSSGQTTEQEPSQTAKQGVGAVIMTNSNNGMPLLLEILRSVFDVYDWPGFNYKKTAVELEPTDLERCPGEFTASIQERTGKEISVTFKLQIEDDSLMLTLPYPEFGSTTTKTIPLTAESDHAFFNIENEMEVRFNDDYSELHFCDVPAQRVPVEHSDQLDSASNHVTSSTIK